MYHRCLFAICLLLAGCSPSGQQAPQPDTPPAYRTTQPSLLYFKNMRSSNYRQEEQKGTRIIYYTHNRFLTQSSDSLGFVPRIGSDWLNDRAFLLPYWEGGLIPADPLTLVCTEDTLTAASPSPYAQTDWLLDLYRLQQEGKQARIQLQDGRLYPILQDEQHRNTFNTVVKDYLRLTEQW